MSDIIVALDGGGSKTDAVVVTRDGTVLARGRAGGSSPQIIGVAEASAVVDTLVREVLAQAGADVPDRVHAYLSGLDLPEETAAFRAAISSASWMPRDPAALVVDNDMFALLRAGTDASDAVAVVCGTGINAIGVRTDGACVRFPALGPLTGDWGGGWQLGQQALWHAARAVDGRGPDTVLVDEICAVFGRASLHEVIVALHHGEIAEATLRTLCPVLLRASAAGDAVARSLVDRQAEEIVTMAVTTLRRLELLDRDVPVVLGGGVIASGDAVLHELINAGMAARAPRARLEMVHTPPVVGAVLLAVDAAGGTADAAALARATVASGGVVAAGGI